MYVNEYGLRCFKHKMNFNNLVVFSDSLQDKLKNTEPQSTNLYIEITYGVKSPDKWFLHVNSRLSGEYGDFFLESRKPEG